MRVLVLGGAGAQGRAVAALLALRPDVDEVVAADLHPPPAAAPAPVRFERLDALDAAAVAAAAKGADVAVNAVPGSLGLRSLTNLVRAGVPTLDLAFMPEAPFHLDPEARRSGAPVVVDCGVAPGLANVLAARAHRELGGLDQLRIYVGGFPLQPPPGFVHAVYFNARDLLDEYIRPARRRRAGSDESPQPLDEPVELLEDPDAGPLEAFASDGLRSLLTSYPEVPDMAELTLRLPGHLAAMRLLRNVGLLEGDASTDALARALGARFPAERFPDRLLMEVWGERRGEEQRYRLHVLRSADASAMARATAGKAAAAAALLGRGVFAEPGVHAPEALGRDERACEALLAELHGQGLAIAPRGRLAPRPA